VLGREAIVDCKYGALRVISEAAAKGVVTVETAEHPAATVEERHNRRRLERRLETTIEPCTDNMGRGRKFEIAYLGNFWWIGRKGDPAPGISGACVCQGQRFHRLASDGADLIELLLCRYIERHVWLH
jgi:hypothetical protein